MHIFPQAFDPVVFPIACVAMMLLATGIIARVSGWSRLAARYQTDKTFPDETKGWQSAVFGMTSYRGCIWVGCDQNGLYLKTGPWIVYRFQHPPLFIPWSAISEAKQIQRFWRKYIKIVLRDPEISICLSDGAFRDHMRYLYDNKLLQQRVE